MVRIFMIIEIITLPFLCMSIVHAVNNNTPIINKYGQTGFFNMHSAKTLGMGRLSVIAYGNTSRYKNFVISVIDDNTPPVWNDSLVNPNMTISSFDFSIGYGITRYLDIALTLPFYIDNITEYRHGDSHSFGGTAKTGLGDLEFSLKWQYPPYPHKKIFEMAYFSAVSIPTGDRILDPYFPRHTYYFYKDSSREVKGFYSSEYPEIDMKMLWTLDFNELRHSIPIEFHLNYGIRWTHSDLDHLFLLNAGLSYRPINWFTFFTEFTGETRISNLDRGFRIGDDPLRLSPGISITPPVGFFLTLGMDISLASDKKLKYHVMDKGFTKKLMTTEIEPQYRFAVSIGWNGFVMPQDIDKDGIKDNNDHCPKDAEDFDGFEDEDGCPEKDNDGDGILDSLDKCPNDKEDLDGFEDVEGCPDFDNDKDNIIDLQDECPLIPEDKDGFKDEDGCIDPDNDEDGVIDSLDHCIDNAEDKDGFEDEDGCPDPDNDRDAFLDSLDKCPNQAEVYNAFEDDDGCPDENQNITPIAKEIKRGRVILRGVKFESGRDVLTVDSYVILDQVYASLSEWPEIKIEIRGHTDSTGGLISNNRLSLRRAESVRDYLISKGISPERLIPIGKGELEPIADNNTSEGRAINRRVELHRID